MSISNTKKIIHFFFILLFLIGFIFPFFAGAATPTMELTRFSELENGQTGKWQWVMQINTTNIPDNTAINIHLYEKIPGDIKNISNGIEKIKINSATYYTGPILESNKSYVITAIVSHYNLSKTYSNTIPEGTANPSNVLGGDPNTAIGAPPTPLPSQNQSATQQAKPVNTKTTYSPLAPLPDGTGQLMGEIDTDPGCTTDDKGVKTCTNPCPFGKYLNIVIKFFIGMAAVLSMIMIVMGGIEYMTSDLVSSKESGKSKITNAVLGLLLALGSYAILNTLNPKLLEVCLNNLPEAKITILPYDAGINSYIEKTSGNCKVLTSGSCSVQNFKNKNIFSGKEENASKICNIESGGVVASESKTDKCSDGKVFSFGLFQMNLLIHGKSIPTSVGNCSDLFTRNDGSSVTKGYVERDQNGKYIYNCKLKTGRESDYIKCSNYLKTADGNLLLASNLFKTRAFKDWQKSDEKVCSSAFQ